MRQQILEFILSGGENLSIIYNFIASNIVEVSREIPLGEIQKLLDEGIMTPNDVKIIKESQPLIIADIERIINTGIDENASKDLVLRRLAYCLVSKYHLTWPYSKYILKQIIPLI